MRRVFPLYRYTVHSRSLDGIYNKLYNFTLFMIEIDSMAFRFYVDSKYLFLSKENYTRNGAVSNPTHF